MVENVVEISDLTKTWSPCGKVFAKSLNMEIQNPLKISLILLLTIPHLLVSETSARSQRSLAPTVDLVLETDRSEFRVRRFPNPLFRGYFGKGWCSDIDLRLDVRSDKTVLLKSCRISNPIRFDFDLSSETKNTQGLTLKRVDDSFILKRFGIAIAQFNAHGRPTAIRSSHDENAPSSEWLRFRYSDGQLQELGFWKDEGPARSTAAVATDRAIVSVDPLTNTILSIQTKSSSIRYHYRSRRLTRTQNLPIERSPD